MGSVDGGLSQQYNITGIGNIIQIPLPTDPALMDSVILYNFSPYLIEVQSGVDNNGWLGSYMADRFSVGNTSTLNLVPASIVGQNPSAQINVATVTAGFITTGSKNENTGTYPVSLLSSAGVVLANELDILYPDGNVAIKAYDDPVLGPIVGFFNDATGAPLAFYLSESFGLVNPLLNTGLSAGLYFQVNNGTLPSKAPETIVTSGEFNIGNGVAQITCVGGAANNAAPPAISLSALGGNIVVDSPLLRDNPKTLTLQNGWTAFDPAHKPTYRLDSEGRVRLDGIMTGGATGSNTLIATLPAGYQPATLRQVIVSGGATISPFCVVLQIATNGNINLFAGTSNPNAISLDGVTFSL